MKPLGFEFRQLRYFVAVVEQGSFRGAALRLHVSQPPLTRQIQQLERVVGTPLLVRSARGVSVTEAGRDFYTEARNLLALAMRATHRATSVGNGQAGRLDVGVFGSPIFDMVPHILKLFRQRNSKVVVALHTLDRAEQLKALRERRIDVGINRFLDREPGLAWETVERQALNVAVFDTHRLAPQRTLTLRELVDEELIFYPRAPRPGFMDHVLALFAQHGLVPQRIVNVDDVPTAIAMAASNLGITIVPSSASNLRLSGIKYIPLAPGDRGTVDSVVIYRDEEPSALLQEFLKTTRRYYRSTVESARERDLETS